MSIFLLLPSHWFGRWNTLTWKHNDHVVFLQNKWQQPHRTFVMLLPSILHKVVWIPSLCLLHLCRYVVFPTWRIGCHNWSCKSIPSLGVRWCESSWISSTTQDPPSWPMLLLKCQRPKYYRECILGKSFPLIQPQSTTSPHVWSFFIWCSKNLCQHQPHTHASSLQC
jgi:hypothetical protein